MAKFELTKEQQAVVDNRGGTLLISAAAGSGKTKVLIDRVLKRVEEEQYNIDDFLMITFTHAAASELRGKMIAQLSQRLSECPDNRHLQRQMSRVYLAQISTIHSFCASILREYAHLLDIPGDFRLCDEQEAIIYRERAMQITLETAYRNIREEPQIAAALDMFGRGRDDRALPELMINSFFALQCYQDPKQRIKQLHESLHTENCTDVGQTIWGEYLISEFHAFLDSAIQSMRRAVETITQTDWLAPYLEGFQSDIEQLKLLKQRTQWEDIRKTFVKPAHLSRITKCPDTELKESIQGIKKRIMSVQMEKWSEIFSIPSEEALADLSLTAEALHGFLILTEQFSEQYRKEKGGRRVLDYNDLEHLALKLLVAKDGSRTRAAKEISERFAEIMVDEYQDTNRVQDAIFRAISKDEKNLFFVGDVKQSIYQFRLADPTMFLEKYRKFAPYTQANDGEPRKILLSDNFRSDARILAAANDVFRLCMTERVGGLRYGDDEALRAKAIIPKSSDCPVELHCLNTKTIPSQPKTSNDEIESEFIARRIEKMLKNKEMIPESADSFRPIRPEDIVILCRSMKNKPQIYMNALGRHGIRCVCGNDNIFLSEEITILSALLQVIDNPHQDIPLLTVLFSPLFCFSSDDLALAHTQDRNGDLFDAILKYDKAESFVSFLNEMRNLAQTSSLHNLLNTLEERLFLRAIFGAMDAGEQRIRNLERFFALADTFENGERFGLGSFLSYLELMKKKGVQTEDSKITGAVRLMTMHASKGLEFPVVFLADLCRPFNMENAKAPLLVDAQLGIGANVFAPEQRLSYPTVARNAIVNRIRKESISEEMRILYVAMTRAKYKMIMTCCGSNLTGMLSRIASELTNPAEDLLIESAQNHAHWILMCAMSRAEAGCLFEAGGYPEKRFVSDDPWDISFHDGNEFVSDGREMNEGNQSSASQDMIEYQPLHRTHHEAETSPSKITATQLKGRSLDEEISSDAPAQPLFHFPKPQFSKQHKLTPTERGTAIHLAMQYLRYERCIDLPEIEAELDRLLAEKFLTVQQREAVDARKILNFFSSELGQRVLHAKELIREFKFSVLEDGAFLNPALAGEQVLLQGVADCGILEPDGLTIIDFKSDRVTQGEEGKCALYYKGQLDAYSVALSKVFARPIKARYLYFFSIDQAVRVS